MTTPLANNMVGKLVTAWQAIGTSREFTLPLCTGWARAVEIESSHLRFVLELVHTTNDYRTYAAGDVGDLVLLDTAPGGWWGPLAFSTNRHPDAIAELAGEPYEESTLRLAYRRACERIRALEGEPCDHAIVDGSLTVLPLKLASGDGYTVAWCARCGAIKMGHDADAPFSWFPPRARGGS